MDARVEGTSWRIFGKVDRAILDEGRKFGLVVLVRAGQEQ